jgi:UDP-N-acetyl-D-galactosamine dehydrogenase
MKNHHITVVGLGHVGLSLAFESAKYLPVSGFDINMRWIKTLRSGRDSNGEVSDKELRASTLEISSDPRVIKKATS